MYLHEIAYDAKLQRKTLLTHGVNGGNMRPIPNRTSTRLATSVFVAIVVAVSNLPVPVRADVVAESLPPDESSRGGSAQTYAYLPVVMSQLAPIIPPTTVVVVGDLANNLSSSPDSAVLTFTQSSAAVQAITSGKIIVSGPSAAAPNGFLRKVSVVTQQNGQLVAQTIPAALDEAVQQGELNVTQKLTPANIRVASQLPGVKLVASPQSADALSFNFALDDVVLFDQDGNTQTTGDQIRVKGSIKVEPEVNFRFHVKDFQLQDLYFTTSATQTDDVTFTYGPVVEKKAEKQIASYILDPIVGSVGPIPVVLVPVLTVNVGIDGKVFAGVTFGATSQTTVKAGLQYANQAWQPISDYTHTDQWKLPQLTAGAEAKVYFNTPQLTLELYGLVGPHIKIEPFVKLEADTSANPWWALYAGIGADAGISLQLLTHKLADKNLRSIDVRYQLAQANGGFSLSSATSVVAGGEHTCALTNAGGVKCWGSNFYGQLGDGTTTNHSTPAIVTGLSSGITALAAGYQYSCAVMTSGGIKCWGLNYSGQLGDGTMTDRLTPTDVNSLNGTVTAIAAGAGHTCALTTGGVKCWGSNSSGQLGDSTTINRSTPVNVSGLSSGLTAIAMGFNHTCVLMIDGSVKCWGDNHFGQLGDGTTTNRLVPVDVSGLGGRVVAIATGEEHTCAAMSTGGVKCWGWNFDGELGDGTTIGHITPVNVSGLSESVKAISGGLFHTCALTMGGAVKCWGNNRYGQLGDHTTTNRLAPVDVSELSSDGVVIAVGGQHTCAVMSTGRVKCWGDNSTGQLGNGTDGAQPTLQDVSGLANGATAVATTGEHTCALTSGGAVKCWGANHTGQSGDGTTMNRQTPVDVSGLGSGVVAIATGFAHTCALTTSGSVKCWGYNFYGQLGDGTTTNRVVPVDVSELSNGVRAIAAGGDHTCALTNNGGIKCWGFNGGGQLGDETTTNRLTPVNVSGLSSSVATIAAGFYHTCALTNNGGIKCWGYNFDGQLGDGTLTNRLTPVSVNGLDSGVIAIATGWYHTCALTSSGGVKCWGVNGAGQLGDGTTTYRLTPVDVTGLVGGVSAIAPGGGHTCALTTGGNVKCWGNNADGQLGDGTTTNRLTPGNVNRLSSGVVMIATGLGHTCALTSASGIKCWGLKGFGQLGDGSRAYSDAPVDAVGLGIVE